MSTDIWNVGNTDIGWFLNYYIYEPLIHPFLAVQEHKFKSSWVPVRSTGPDKPTVTHPPLCELVAEELLLGLLVDLSQHLVHHAEQRTAQAQQLIQEHIVM